MKIWRQNGWRRDLGLMLWVLAMAVRALVPAGFMVAPASAGDGVSVVFCSGFGPVEGELLASGELLTGSALEAKHATEAAAKHKAPCPSAGVALDLVTPLSLSLVPALATGHERTLPAESAALSRAVPGLPAKRGPPLLS